MPIVLTPRGSDPHCSLDSKYFPKPTQNRAVLLVSSGFSVLESFQGERFVLLLVFAFSTPKLVLAAGAKSHISLDYHQYQITKQAGTDKGKKKKK